MAEINITHTSPELAKIRPVNLEESDIQILAPRWRECCCCREPLTEQAVQIQCCDTIFHARCIREYAEAQALIYREPGDESNAFCCPWCTAPINCRWSDVWSFLDESAISDVLAVGDRLDKWLSLFSKLGRDARLQFIDLAVFYESISGRPSKTIRLPAMVYSIRKLCGSDRSARKAFERLYRYRRLSFDAILTWKEWLIRDDDLEDVEDLIRAETIYGKGPDRFVANIIDRLRQD